MADSIQPIGTRSKNAASCRYDQQSLLGSSQVVLRPELAVDGLPKKLAIPGQVIVPATPKRVRNVSVIQTALMLIGWIPDRPQRLNAFRVALKSSEKV
jgi:hypothetical protein